MNQSNTADPKRTALIFFLVAIVIAVGAVALYLNYKNLKYVNTTIEEAVTAKQKQKADYLILNAIALWPQAVSLKKTEDSKFSQLICYVPLVDSNWTEEKSVSYFACIDIYGSDAVREGLDGFFSSDYGIREDRAGDIMDSLLSLPYERVTIKGRVDDHMEALAYSDMKKKAGIKPALRSDLQIIAYNQDANDGFGALFVAAISLVCFCLSVFYFRKYKTEQEIIKQRLLEEYQPYDNLSDVGQNRP
ncbi:MAG: hypothetical protein U0V74_14685 [Chitinophagales bacterium]